MAVLPEFDSQVRANDFSVRERSAASPEAETIFRSAAQAQAMADQAGGRAVREAEQHGADAGAATIVYEQQSDGTTRLRPLDSMLAWNVGGANRAYNAAVMRNYGAAVETDARATFGRLQTQYANDTAGFAAASRAYVDTTTEAMPERYRGMVNTQLNVMASQFGTALHERTFRVAQDQRYGVGLAGVMDTGRDAANLALAGDTTRANQQLARLSQQLNDLRTEHPDRITQVQIDTLIREARVDVSASTLQNQAIAAFRAGGERGILAAEALVRQWQDTGTQPGAAAGQPPPRRSPPTEVPEPSAEQRRAMEAQGIDPDAYPGGPHDPARGWEQGQPDLPRAARPPAEHVAPTPGARLPGAAAPAAAAGGTPVHTPTERTIIAGRALARVRDLQHERDLGRAITDQQTTDQALSLRIAYERILNQNPGMSQADQALAAQRIQREAPTQAAGDRFMIAVTNPALAAETAARERELVVLAQQSARAAAEARTETQAYSAQMIDQGRVAIGGRNARDATGMEQDAAEYATRAATRGWTDRSRMTDAEAQNQPQQPFDQAAYDHVYSTLVGPSQAVTRTRAAAEQAQIETLTALDMENRANAARTGQTAQPYPYSELMRRLPVDQWDNAARTLNESNKHMFEQMAEVTAANRAVAGRTQNDAPVPQATVDKVADNMAVSPNDPTARGQLPLDMSAQGRANIRRVADLATATGQIPSYFMTRLDAGLTSTADFTAVRLSNEMRTALLANPMTRPRMEQLLGERMAVLDENATAIATIIESPANQVRGEPDASKMEVAWQTFRNGRDEALRMPAAELTRRATGVYATSDYGAAQVSDLQARIATQQTQQIDVWREGVRQINPVMAVLNMLGLFDTRVPAGSVAGVANAPGWISSIVGTSLADMLLGPPENVRVGNSTGEIPHGAVQLYQRYANRAMVQGMNERSQVDESGWREVGRQYRPSVFSTPQRDRAQLTYFGLEETNQRLYNQGPANTAMQLAQFYDTAQAQARARNQPLELRSQTGAEAVARGDIYVRFIRGTESNPRYDVFVRPADGPGGSPRDHQPLWYIPGMQGTAMDYSRQDQATFALRSTTGTTPAERAASEALDRRAIAIANERLPGGLSTATRSNVIQIIRFQLGLGMEPIIPGGDPPGPRP